MIKLPTARQPREIADWIEAELLFSDRHSISTTELHGILSDDFGLAEDWSDVVHSGDFEPLAELEEAEDELAQLIEQSFLLLEQRRRRTGGRRYPVVVDSGPASVSGDWKDHLAYAFLTLLNARVVLGLGRRVDHHRPAILFERLVRTALARYVGGEAARFGVPDPDFVGDFPERARQLAVRMRERPMPELTTITPQQQDHGLDVAAWRSFDDRYSKIIVLCQCGIGDDFEGKFMPEQRWLKVIDFACTPLRALAIPFQDFAPEAKIRGLAVDSGILLDRTRIARFAKVNADETLREDIVEWIVSVLPKFDIAADDSAPVPL